MFDRDISLELKGERVYMYITNSIREKKSRTDIEEIMRQMSNSSLEYAVEKIDENNCMDSSTKEEVKAIFKLIVEERNKSSR